MSTRRLFFSALVLSGIVSAGCHPNSRGPGASSRIAAGPPAATQPAAPREATAAEPRPVITDTSSTADTVALKAHTYAAQMEALLKERDAKAATQQPATRPAQASQVAFIESVSAVKGPRDAEQRPPAKSASEASALSNTGLAVRASSQSSAREGPPNLETVDRAVPSAPAVLLPQPQPLMMPVAIAPANLDELTARLTKHAKDYPQEIAGQFELQLMKFIRGESVPDLQLLAGLGSEDRELLAALMDGLSNFHNAVRADNNMLLSRKIRPMLEMADRLRTQSELSVPVVALCRKVTKFGSYEPLEPARFVAGLEHEVIVYCEVENFSSQLDSQKQWQTTLRQEIVLYSDQGLQVWTPDKVVPRPTTDTSRARRHDFFLGRIIKLPANLSMGRYILKVSIVDQQASRVAENTTPLEIVAQ